MGLMDRPQRGASPIDFKLEDLRGRVGAIEEMEENRFLLFSAAGCVSALISLLGAIFIVTSSRLDPLDIPALYGLTGFFFASGLALAWNGRRATECTRRLDELRHQLSQLEQASFIADVERFGDGRPG